MTKVFSTMLALVGLAAATSSTVACTWFYLDEPEAPASLIK